MHVTITKINIILNVSHGFPLLYMTLTENTIPNAAKKHIRAAL